MSDDDMLGRGDPTIRFSGVALRNPVDFSGGGFGRIGGNGEAPSGRSPAPNIPAVFGPSVREPQKTLEINRVPDAAAAAETRNLIIVQGTAANKFQISPGYVNFEMPTLGAVALNNTTPPEVTVSADTWFWVKVVGSFGVGGEDTYVVTIETSSTNATPAGTEITEAGFTAFRSIGHVDFTAGSPNDTFEIYNVYEGGNMGVDSYGNVNLFWRQ